MIEIKKKYQEFYKINPISLDLYSVSFRHNKTWGSMMSNFEYIALKVKFSQNLA